MVDVPQHVRYWVDGATSNLDTARLLLEHRKFIEALFFAHLSLEKGLKAVFTLRQGDVPPRVHNLLRLAELASVDLSTDNVRLFSRLNTFQLEGRYPSLWPSEPAEVEAEQLILECMGVLTWLQTTLQEV